MSVLDPRSVHVLSGLTIGALLASSFAFTLWEAASILWAVYFIVKEVRK